MSGPTRARTGARRSASLAHPRVPASGDRPPSEGAATYVYAVVASAGEPDTAGAPAGLPGTARLRWLAIGDHLWLATADAPLARYSALAIEKGLKDLEWVSACAVAHERMVEYAVSLGTAVPMKLFTLFTSDARAVEHVGRSRSRLRRVLRHLAGRQEWGVRVSVDEAGARSAARARAEPAAASLRAGARFLTRKRQEHAEVRDIVRIGREAAEEVFQDAARHADETRRREPAAGGPGLRLLLDAAFLVPLPKVPAFQDALRRHLERLAPRGYRVVLTGPWPAYNFVGDER